MLLHYHVAHPCPSRRAAAGPCPLCSLTAGQCHCHAVLPAQGLDCIPCMHHHQACHESSMPSMPCRCPAPPHTGRWPGSRACRCRARAMRRSCWPLCQVGRGTNCSCDLRVSCPACSVALLNWQSCLFGCPESQHSARVSARRCVSVGWKLVDRHVTRVKICSAAPGTACSAPGTACCPGRCCACLWCRVARCYRSSAHQAALSRPFRRTCAGVALAVCIMAVRASSISPRSCRCH